MIQHFFFYSSKKAKGGTQNGGTEWSEWMRLWNKIPSVKSTILSLFDKERRERGRERGTERDVQKQTQQFYNILCLFLCLCFAFRDKTWDRSGIHANAIFKQAAKWGGNTLKKFELNFLIIYRIHLHNFPKSPLSLSLSALIVQPFLQVDSKFPPIERKTILPPECLCLPACRSFCHFWWGWCCLLPFPLPPLPHPLLLSSLFLCIYK